MRVLLYLPLVVIVTLSIFSMLGLGSSVLGVLGVGGDPSTAKYYDYGGHELCTVADLVPSGEQGKIINDGGYAMWQNQTSTWYNTVPIYSMWYDTNHLNRLTFDKVGQTWDGGIGDISLASSLGMIALIVGIMALAVLVGVKVFGFGTSNSMVVVYGTAYLGIWGVFSALAMTLILAMGIIGNFFYFIVTIMYTLGILSSFNGSGED